MRRIATLLLPFLLPCLSYPTFAQNEAWDKAQISEAMKKEAELKAEGWKLLGGADTLMRTLLVHHMKLDRAGEGSQELFGYADTEKLKYADDLNTLISKARLYAKNTYVKQRHSYIVSRAVTELGLSSDSQSEFEQFYSASRLNAEGVVRNELEESFVLIRQPSVGPTELMVFYIVNPEKVAESNIKAFQNTTRKASKPNLKQK